MFQFCRTNTKRLAPSEKHTQNQASGTKSFHHHGAQSMAVPAPVSPYNSSPGSDGLEFRLGPKEGEHPGRWLLVLDSLMVREGNKNHPIFIHKHTYCGWKKSCITLDGWTPINIYKSHKSINKINNGINHLSSGAGVLPSRVSHFLFTDFDSFPTALQWTREPCWSLMGSLDLYTMNITSSTLAHQRSSP